MKKDFQYNINGNDYQVTVENVTDNVATVIVNGCTYQVNLPQPAVVKKAVAKVAAAAAPADEKPRIISVKAPLPGVINDVKVKVGDVVKPGDVAVVLEAMKMENNLDIEKGGTVKEICVAPGDTVREGTDLVILE